ncbi:MAG: hypothetical protein ABJD97_09445, partial [Betaproteobacteria bacterium]
CQSCHDLFDDPPNHSSRSCVLADDGRTGVVVLASSAAVRVADSSVRGTAHLPIVGALRVN